MNETPPIPDGYKKNFEQVRAAVLRDDACLVSAFDQKTESDVVMLCASHTADNGIVNITPFAVMCEGNPYDRYVPFERPSESAGDAPELQKWKVELGIAEYGGFWEPFLMGVFEAPDVERAFEIARDELLDSDHGYDLAGVWLHSIFLVEDGEDQ